MPLMAKRKWSGYGNFQQKNSIEMEEKKNGYNSSMLCISTSEGELRTPFAGRKHFFLQKKLIEQHKKNTRKTLIETTQAPSVDKNVMCALLMKLVNH